MAITGTLLNAIFSISTDGTAVSLTANVTLTDDTLGVVGGRSIEQDDPQIVAAVMGFITQMLPSLEYKAGFPVSLPRPVKEEAILSEVAISVAAPQIIK